MKTTLMISLLALAGLVRAQGMPLHTISGGTLGLQLSDHSFDAARQGSVDMHLSGRKLGILADFAQAFPSGWYWGGDARVATGSTAFASATRGNTSGSPETLSEARLIFGRDGALGSAVVSPYTGLGYRVMESFLTGYTTTGNIAPLRSSSIYYLPIGLTHRARLGAHARLVSTLEYDYLLQGTQHTRYTDIVGFTQDLNVTQRQGHGLRLSFARETPQGSVGVYYHAWAIAESDVGTYANTTTVFSATEAGSVSRELGIQIRFRFE